MPSVLVPQIETAQDAGNILVPGSPRQPISCYTTMPCPSFQAPGKAWPLRREPELGKQSHLEELGGPYLQQETSFGSTSTCTPLRAFARAGVRFQLGLLASRSDCWWILFKIRPEEGSGGKQSEPEALEGSESGSREWSFHLSTVFTAGASLTSSSIVPGWQPSMARPFQTLPRGAEMDALGRAARFLERKQPWTGSH